MGGKHAGRTSSEHAIRPHAEKIRDGSYHGISEFVARRDWQRRRQAPGLQVLPSSAIRKFADRFPATLEGIKQMALEIGSFERVDVGQGLCGRLYGFRTAHDVISTRRIMTGARLVGGCMDYSHAMIGALRAKGLKASLVRFKDVINSQGYMGYHALVRFELGGRWYAADADPSVTPKIVEETDSQRRAIAAQKRAGRLTEGLDGWDIGITKHNGVIRILKPQSNTPWFIPEAN